MSSKNLSRIPGIHLLIFLTVVNLGSQDALGTHRKRKIAVDHMQGNA
jgi:hypothetical protein